jgi:hypothetical protein
MGNDASVDNKGTELEKIQEEQAIQDTIFADTFDAAEKLGDSPDSTMSDDSGKKADDDAAAKAAEAEAAAAAGADQKAAQDAADKGKADDKGKEGKEGKDDEQTYEQRWKSLQGILKSKDEKYEAEKAQMLAEMESLKKTVANISAEDKDKKDKKGTGKSDSIFDDLSEEDKEALAEYEKDFDSVSKMEGLKRERALKKLEDRILARLEERTTELQTKIDSRIQPVEETFKKIDETTHFKSIRESHPDFEKHRDSGAILKWIETKPRYLQESMKATYGQGTAEDVVDLISDFKKENGLLETNKDDQSRKDNLVDLDKKKAEKKQNLTAVITKRGSVDTGQGRADDFDSAYNEALKR